jgi:Ca2+-binding RTX toxin-like protein
MTVITVSTGALTLSGNQTTVIAPAVTVDAMSTNINPAVTAINYGKIGGASYDGSSVHIQGDGSAFTNKPGGIVFATGASVSSISIGGSGNVVFNQGIVLNNAFHGIVVSNGALGSVPNNDSIVNSGDIYAALNGIWVNAASAQNLRITNSGEIAGDTNGIHMQFGVGAAPVIVNTGTITGRASSIVATDGDRLNVTNSGTLNGNVVATSAGQTDVVTNNGRIVGNVSLGSGNDLYRGVGNVTGTVLGEAGIDTLSGGNGIDRLNGGIGNDTLNGGLGIDNLTGGANSDFFVFNTALNAATNRDIVTDFSHVDDTFRLENAIFTKLAAVGTLNPAFFRAGTTALDANDYIVYNQATGALSYDSNGSLAGGSIAFAALINKPVLAYNDFVVI